jgi:nitrate reductase gamma subunit
LFRVNKMRVRQSQASSDLVAIVVVIIVIVEGSTDTVLLQAIVHSHVLREREGRVEPMLVACH